MICSLPPAILRKPVQGRPRNLLSTQTHTRLFSPGILQARENGVSKELLRGSRQPLILFQLPALTEDSLLRSYSRLTSLLAVYCSHQSVYRTFFDRSSGRDFFFLRHSTLHCLSAFRSDNRTPSEYHCCCPLGKHTVQES